MDGSINIYSIGRYPQIAVYLFRTVAYMYSVHIGVVTTRSRRMKSRIQNIIIAKRRRRRRRRILSLLLLND